MPVAVNQIDFNSAPFVEGPNGAYYVQPHRAFRDFPAEHRPQELPRYGVRRAGKAGETVSNGWNPYHLAFCRGFLYGAVIGFVVSGLIWRFAR
jgi:hypothetical protein